MKHSAHSHDTLPEQHTGRDRGGFHPVAVRDVSPGAASPSSAAQAQAVPEPAPHAAPISRGSPSVLDRLVGATNLSFGAFLCLAYLALPLTGRRDLEFPLSPNLQEPSLALLLLAPLIILAGFEKWTGRQEWVLAVAARFAPRSRGDPLGYTLLVVLFWLLWKAFIYGAALAAPFYTAIYWLKATGRV